MHFSRNSQGFSLVELLLYLGITAVVIGLFGGILITILRIQTQQTASRQVITELNFVMNTIKRHIFDSVSLTVTTSTLTVGTGATSTDPTVFTTASSTVFMSEAGGDAFPLSSDKVTVSNLAFTDLHYASSQAVQIVLTMQFNSANPAQAVTQTLQSTAAPLRKSN